MRHMLEQGQRSMLLHLARYVATVTSLDGDMNLYEEVMEEVKAEFAEVMEEVRKEVIEPIVDFGNPERLLGELLKDDPTYGPFVKDGKLPYDIWKANPAIMGWLQQKYGSGPDTKLDRFIFNKDYKALDQLEQAVK